MRTILRTLCALAILAGVGLMQRPAQALPIAGSAPISGSASDLLVQVRTICRYDGYCYNTSGRPIYGHRHHYHRHYHHHRRHYYRSYY